MSLIKVQFKRNVNPNLFGNIVLFIFIVVKLEIDDNIICPNWVGIKIPGRVFSETHDSKSVEPSSDPTKSDKLVSSNACR